MKKRKKKMIRIAVRSFVITCRSSVMKCREDVAIFRIVVNVDVMMRP